MTSVRVAVSCYNRATATDRCLTALSVAAKRADVSLRINAVDDGSTDSTRSVLERHCASWPGSSITTGPGSWFWATSMRTVLQEQTDDDLLLLLNDDTVLRPDALLILLELLQNSAQIVVGGTVNSDGKPTYGGLRRRSKLRRLTFVPQTAPGIQCDTMNCNIVLMQQAAYYDVGGFSGRFTHSFADIDLGLRATGAGYRIVHAGDVGLCEKNSFASTWEDVALSRRERFLELRSPKGLPIAEWVYFTLRHGGALAPAYLVSPILKIMIRTDKADLVKGPAR